MKKYKWGLLVLIIIGLAVAGYLWWRHGQRYPGTSDAYTDAHVARIASQVTGQVLALHVKDHQQVESGQLLLEIDPQPYQISLAQAEANLDLARQQQAEAAAAVKTARARVSEAEAQRADAKRNYKRMQTLVSKKSVSTAEADSARFKLKEANAGLDAVRAELQQAMQKQAESDAAIRLAQAKIDQARLDLSHTRIAAPAAGTVGEVKLRPGNVIQKGQALFPLVEGEVFWVNANFKETDLLRIRPGQSATVEVDMYPGKIFHGVVESISPASGTAFALLPPENATGNWVKVTQRFPVRVRITELDPARPLRIGASSVVTVDTVSGRD